ncbi:MAG TPA: hypothetical protein VFQ44_06060 [Streptosporangiaceae bacterium]|nr:hypothetical protein [Streptosporangiaceae bacterium]
MPRIAAVTAIAAVALAITPLFARSHAPARPTSVALASKAAPAAPAADPVPAATSVMVSSFWGWPWARQTGTALPLTGGGCSKLKLRNDTPIGYVQAPSGASSRVLGSCVKGTSVVVLKLPGLADTGATYTGSATIGGQQVAVTVVRSVNLLWPLIALIAGIVLALLMLHVGPKLAIDGLTRRLKEAQAAIGAPGIPDGIDVSASVTSTCLTISSDLTALRRAKWLSLTTDDAQVKALDERISAIEGVRGQLTAVAKDLTELASALRGDAARLVPAWGAAVTRQCLSHPAQLSLGELTELAANAEDARKLATWLPDASQQVGAVRERLDELRSYQVSDPRVQTEIGRAGRLLDEALAGFSRAETPAAVRDAYQNKFIGARTVVDGLNSVSEPRVAVREFAAEAERGALPRPAGLPLAGSPPPSPRELAHQVAAIAAADQGASIAALAVICGLLLFAGLQALAIGKTFGTPWDFVAAVAWGSGAVAVGSPLASAIERFGQIRPVAG